MYCHANTYLTGESERAPEFLTNSTFAPVHEVVFERTGTSKLASGIVADAPGPWLRRLNKEGVARLGLSLMSCPFDPLVTPSEPWGVLTDGDVGVEIWQPTWRKRIRSHGDASPWHVTYVSTRASRWSVQTPLGIADSDKLLKSLIVQAANEFPAFRSVFDSAESQFADLLTMEWSPEHRELAELAALIGSLVRSETWAKVAQNREMTPEDHSVVSQKLWKASLMALETSAKSGYLGPNQLAESAFVEHPTSHTLPLAG